MLTHQRARLCLVVAGACAIAPAAWAADIAVKTAPLQPPVIEPAPLQVPFKPVSELGRTIDPGRLAGLRGGDGTQVENLVDVDGSVDGNTAHHVTTGTNSVADGAFNNASGINTVIQNTGNNVLIQNAMIVTVDFTGGGPP
ncbi:hypothetical protein SAMN05428982_2004 [Pseudoxanthomonas sp. CF385]|uniref:hypothetical protein n=1 Tax=Pseudoxanthomonas sp. CF385 TaxID=1881042 RepID=UPI00087F3244|nr:hypothetical protein [Pseudoxanthomonas sp. CF385]SDQ65991.1 hypothetical protein SAMN05428982_2004 [Pseudoxanthomonas sp. CF385]